VCSASGRREGIFIRVRTGREPASPLIAFAEEQGGGRLAAVRFVADKTSNGEYGLRVGADATGMLTIGRRPSATSHGTTIRFIARTERPITRAASAPPGN